MLIDISGNKQPAVGMQPHWKMFGDISSDPKLFNPLRDQIVQIVNTVVTANPRPFIDSRQAVSSTLNDLSSWWRGEFPRRFPHFPNGSERGVCGMVLWNYLANLSGKWCFSVIKDTHGYGQSAKNYWRL